MSLEEYLGRALSPPAPELLGQLREPIDPAQALAPGAIQRLLDPAPLACESGWCVLADGVGYVAVRTEMPRVSAAMMSWWFDWHPRAAERYRAWHPLAHIDNRLERAGADRSSPHYGAIHHPVERIGRRVFHARIRFLRPSELGFGSDELPAPVALIVAGRAGDDRLRVEHTLMAHVFLHRDDGLVLRSHFWLGQQLRPYPPLGGLAPLLDRPAVRRLALPGSAVRALAVHCAEEYANLAAILPELFARHGG